MTTKNPLEALRHHVTGAIERGEAEAIVEKILAPPEKLYRRLARLAAQHQNCIAQNNIEWEEKSRLALLALVSDSMPSGSGIDHATKIDLDKSDGEKLIFYVDYHHMNGESGMYDGWTSHVVTVRGSLWTDFNLSISGRDRDGIKEYLHDVYSTALSEVVAE